MGKMRWITGAVMVVFSLTAGAQQQRDQAGQQNTQNQVRTERQSTNEQESTDRQKSTADTPGAQDAAVQANDNNQQASRDGEGNTPAESGAGADVSSSAAMQSTSSSSGSPAVLSSDKGSGRDGTNTVQRASMNMAGSPAENLRLDNEQGNADQELKDRQDYTRDKQVSANRTGDAGASGVAQDINNGTRRENNAQSDQNLSAKERKAQPQDDQNKRSERKSKRKRNRG